MSIDEFLRKTNSPLSTPFTYLFFCRTKQNIVTICILISTYDTNGQKNKIVYFKNSNNLWEIIIIIMSC